MQTSIIICTYNEEDTICNVVALCLQHNPFAEIRVVDFESTDNTESALITLAAHYTFDYLKIPSNKERGYAMSLGIKYSSGEVIIFLNTNISGIFRKGHFIKIVDPINNEQVNMVACTPVEVLVNSQITPFKSLTCAMRC